MLLHPKVAKKVAIALQLLEATFRTDSIEIIERPGEYVEVRTTHQDELTYRIDVETFVAQYRMNSDEWVKCYW